MTMIIMGCWYKGFSIKYFYKRILKMKGTLDLLFFSTLKYADEFKWKKSPTFVIFHISTYLMDTTTTRLMLHHAQCLKHNLLFKTKEFLLPLSPPAVSPGFAGAGPIWPLPSVGIGSRIPLPLLAIPRPMPPPLLLPIDGFPDIPLLLPIPRLLPPGPKLPLPPGPKLFPPGPDLLLPPSLPAMTSILCVCKWEYVFK